jgi:lipopolysaccharide/colanic/teichoic acid biosynthesis glycosyltransferase
VSSLRKDRDSALSSGANVRRTMANRDVLKEEEFRRMLALERKRSERTKAPFLLMLAECTAAATHESEAATLGKMGSVLLKDSRETDVIGWYNDSSVLGVLFTGLSAGERGPILEKIAERLKSKLERGLAPDELQRVRFSYHFFPDDWDLSNFDDPGNPTLYIDNTLAAKRKRIPLAIKRFLDIVFSSVVLIVCLPLFLWIALAIKASSKGPVLFRQRRIGQHGKHFEFLKFRSMYENSDILVHKNFVQGLIADTTPEEPLRDERNELYKIQNDDRVTRVGRFLRRTSLDELPQLLNVLKGEMSLVGPRPAIPYEVEIYQTWHRRRVLAAKPGITGIWQVTGRSRVKFDEMVRMDLRYAMAWSPWLDLKILLLTPFAVFRAIGAF